MTTMEYLTSKKITPVIRIVAGSNKAEAFVTMTIEQFEKYGKHCTEKLLPTDEDIKLFSEWCGKSYIRGDGGWWHRYNPQTLENIITTDTLLKWWNERNYTEKEATE